MKIYCVIFLVEMEFYENFEYFFGVIKINVIINKNFLEKLWMYKMLFVFLRRFIVNCWRKVGKFVVVKSVVNFKLYYGMKILKICNIFYLGLLFWW